MFRFIRDIIDSYIKQSFIAMIIASIYMLAFVFFIFTENNYIKINDATLYSLKITAIYLSLYVGVISVYLSIWCDNESQNNHIVILLKRVNLISIILIILTPFIGVIVPITNSYVPFNDNLLFILGISIFNASVLIQTVYFLWFECMLIWYRKNIFYSYKLPSLLLVLNLYLNLSISYINLSQDIGVKRMHLSVYYDRLLHSAAYVMYFLYIMLFVILLHGIQALYLKRKNLGLKHKINMKLLYPSITVAIKNKTWISLLYIITFISFCVYNNTNSTYFILNTGSL